MSSIVPWVPSQQTLFSFEATINGAQYLVSTPWNVFGQRYFLKIVDSSGNLILYRSLVATGPQIQGSFSWADNLATVQCASGHGVPLCGLVNVYISQTDSAFDGFVQALSTGPTTLTYALTTDPQESEPVSGAVNFTINLLAGLNLGWMILDFPKQQFEFGP
jgi:hypothetical protein